MADAKASLGQEGVLEVKDAAHVYDEPTPPTRDEQVAYFKKNGFVVLRNMLSQAEVTELDEELARLARDYEKMPSIREGYDLEPNQDSKRKGPTFRKIGGISDMSEPFNRLLKYDAIMDVLHGIMGDEVYLFRDVVMMKPARVGREKPWHQDAVYWPYEPMELVSTMTALDDATQENGCLQVIPGSHKQVYQHYGQELRLDLDEELQSRTVAVPLKAGDTLIFHSMLLHGSQPNHSDHDRRMTIFSYMPAGLKKVRDGGHDPVLISKRS